MEASSLQNEMVNKSLKKIGKIKVKAMEIYNSCISFLEIIIERKKFG
jgi:vesicle coat complex subunit